MLTRVFILAVLAAALVSAADPIRILVAYDSRTGNTEKLAQSVRDGAASVEGVVVTLRNVPQVKPDEITAADGVLIGTPVHWHNQTSAVKGFIDRLAETLSKSGPDWGEGRLAGVFCTMGNPGSGDGLTRLSLIESLLALRFVIVGGVNAQGYGTLGPMAITGPTSPGIDDAERTEARAFGARFAQIAVKWKPAR